MLARFRNRVAALGAAVILGTLAGCAGTGEKVGTAVDDTAITTKVKSALAADREVSATSVHVKTTNGTVNLSGEVKSREEKRKAEEIARKVNGVHAVSNDLVVSK
ncbi:MAG TPA: BON domain-containing protein [Burkholderiales bacterium]|nr:BON domain-containing protein [Burkholderiales bacterium]